MGRQIKSVFGQPGIITGWWALNGLCLPWALPHRRSLALGLPRVVSPSASVAPRIHSSVVGQSHCWLTGFGGVNERTGSVCSPCHQPPPGCTADVTRWSWLSFPLGSNEASRTFYNSTPGTTASWLEEACRIYMISLPRSQVKFGQNTSFLTITCALHFQRVISNSRWRV